MGFSENLDLGAVYMVIRAGGDVFRGQIRMITEKEVQRKIDNRFIIKLHYAFQTFDYLYLVSDFCPGGDIRALI